MVFSAKAPECLLPAFLKVIARHGGGTPGNPQGGNTTRCFREHGGDVLLGRLPVETLNFISVFLEIIYLHYLNFTLKINKYFKRSCSLN